MQKASEKGQKGRFRKLRRSKRWEISVQLLPLLHRWHVEADSPLTSGK